MSKSIKKTMVSKVSQKLDASKKNLWEKKYFFEVLVLLFTFILYLNSIPNSYNLDDELVTINHRLTSKGISAIPEIFSSPYYQDASGYSYEYRPIVLASFAIEHHFFGDSPQVGHFFNIILYGIVCVVLYQLLLLLFKQYSSFIAIAVTLLFVSHPAHTEVVCSIKNRDEVLSLLFGLLCFKAAYNYVLSNKKLYLVYILLSYSLALMSKNTMGILVAIIPLSLILLSGVRLKIVVGVSMLLLAPAFLLLNIGSLYTKVMFCIFTIILIVALYVLVRFKEVKTWIIPQIRSFFTSLSSKQKMQPQIDNQSLSYNDVFFPITSKNVLILIGSIILAGIYVWLISNQHFVIGGGIPLLMIVIIGWSSKKKGFWPLVVLNALIVYSVSIQEESVMKQVMLDLAQLLILYLVFFGDRILKYVALLFLALLVAFFGHLFDFVTFAKYFFSFFVVRNNKYLIAFVIMQFVAFVIEQSFFRPTPFASIQWEEYIPTILSLLALTIVYITEKKGKLAMLVFLTLPLLIFHAVNAEKESIASINTKIENIINQSAQTRVSVINVSENRPINFVETCIKPIDSWSVKLGTSLEVLYHYAYKVVLPYPMSFYYGYQFISPQKITDTVPLISLILYTLFGLGALYLFFTNIIACIGVLIYLISIATFSNLFVPVPGMLAERFLLLPSLGWLIFLVGVLVGQTKSKETQFAFWLSSKKWIKFFLVGLLVVYSSITLYRNLDWKDHLALYRKDIKYVANSSQAHNLLALQLMKNAYKVTDVREQLALRNEGVYHFKRAIELYPTFFNATYDLGRSYLSINEIDSAIVYFKKTALLDSSFTDAFAISGQLLFWQNRLDEAKYYYRKLIQYHPENYIGYEGLSHIYFINQDYNEAQKILKEAIVATPPNPAPCIMVAKTFYALNQRDSTRLWLNKVLVLSPDNIEAKQLLLSLDQH